MHHQTSSFFLLFLWSIDNVKKNSSWPTFNSLFQSNTYRERSDAEFFNVRGGHCAGLRKINLFCAKRLVLYAHRGRIINYVSIFTALAVWADSVSKLQCPSVCVCVPPRFIRFPVDWRLLVEDLIANIGIPLDMFGFLLRALIASWHFGHHTVSQSTVTELHIYFYQIYSSLDF